MPQFIFTFDLTYTEVDGEPQTQHIQYENDPDARAEFLNAGVGPAMESLDMTVLKNRASIVGKFILSGGFLKLDGDVQGHRMNKCSFFLATESDITAVDFHRDQTAVDHMIAWGYDPGIDIVVDNLDNPVVDNSDVQVTT